jgi:hypothetical protein
VLLFQPLYDAYLPMVRRAGRVPRLVTLDAARLADHGGSARGGDRAEDAARHL